MADISVAASVRRDLKEIERVAPALAKSGLAASALRLARAMDARATPVTSVALCARALADTLGQLRGLMPPPEERDQLDDLAARRAARMEAPAAKAAPRAPKRVGKAEQRKRRSA